MMRMRNVSVFGDFRSSFRVPPVRQCAASCRSLSLLFCCFFFAFKLDAFSVFKIPSPEAAGKGHWDHFFLSGQARHPLTPGRGCYFLSLPLLDPVSLVDPRGEPPQDRYSRSSSFLLPACWSDFSCSLLPPVYIGFRGSREHKPFILADQFF